MTSVKGDILSALSSTTRRILGGAAISAVLLGAGSGMAFADVDNSGAGSPVFGDQSNNGLAGDGGDGATSGDATGGDGGTGVDADGDGVADDAGVSDAGGAESGAGGAGGGGGSVGPNSPTQNANNQQQICEANQAAESTGGDGDAVGDEAADGGNGGDIAQTVNCYANFYNVQQGAGSTYGVMSSGDHKVPSKSSEGSEGSKSSSEGSASAGAGSADMTPVGAADTGDGSFTLASSSSDLGDQVALGGAISAAALLGAYGISIARRRVAAHQA